METKFENSYSSEYARRRRRGALPLAFILVVAVLFALPALSAAAQTREVGGAGATDSGNCIAAPCATIAYAISQAEAGDTIDVAPGNYEEQLTIAKPLTLQGDIAGGTEVGPTAATGVVSGSTVTLAAGSDGTVLRDLEISSRAQGQPAIGTTGGPIDDVTIERVDQRGIGSGTPPTIAGPGLEISVPAGGWQVLDSSFEGDYQGILVTGDASDMTVEGSSFDHDRYGFYVERSTPLSPTSTGTIEGLRLSDSEFLEDEYRGLYFEGLSEAVIEGVSVIGTGKSLVGLPFGAAGLSLNLKGGDYGHIKIADSTISESLDDGITIQVRGYPGDTSYEGLAEATLGSVEVTDSTITDNGGPGIAITNEPNLGSATVSDSRIVGNGLNDLITAGTAGSDGIFALNKLPGAPTVAATDNWFGCNEGPAGAACDQVDPEAVAEPWLVLTGGSAAPTLAQGSTTVVSAAIDSNSAGIPAGPVPDGTPVSFAASAGAVAPAATALFGGEATTTYTGSTPGDAGLSATVDGQSIALPVTVLAPPAEPRPPAATQPAAASAPAQSPAPSPAPVVAPPVTIAPTETKAPKVVTPSGNVTVATVGCASSKCEVEATKPAIKIGGQSFKVKVKVPATIAGGASAPVRVVLPKKAREALEAKGKGKVQVKVTVTATDGTTKTVTVSLVVKSKRNPKK